MFSFSLSLFFSFLLHLFDFSYLSYEKIFLNQKRTLVWTLLRNELVSDSQLKGNVSLYFVKVFWKVLHASLTPYVIFGNCNTEICISRIVFKIFECQQQSVHNLVWFPNHLVQCVLKQKIFHFIQTKSVIFGAKTRLLFFFLVLNYLNENR